MKEELRAIIVGKQQNIYYLDDAAYAPSPHVCHWPVMGVSLCNSGVDVFPIAHNGYWYLTMEG